MLTFAEEVISFCKELEFNSKLPPDISIMNPFRDNPEVLKVIDAFYLKYYNDNNPRHFILGINPGRFGGGVTGIPFTDTQRLNDKCGIQMEGIKTFETSSVFVYEMIEKFGGPQKFYSNFYINSICPLGFTSKIKNGRELNYNYYDSPELTKAITGFAVKSIQKQISFGIMRDVCFCLGTGQNYKFLVKLNDEYKFFGKVVPLEHPRFIMQYRSKQKEFFINKYIEEFQKVIS
jgi:hypothetical protein